METNGEEQSTVQTRLRAAITLESEKAILSGIVLAKTQNKKIIRTNPDNKTDIYISLSTKDNGGLFARIFFFNDKISHP